MKTTLITGGARSGKSRLAQELALKAGGPVLFVATAEPGDDDMKARIEDHRRNRPPGWTTLEVKTRLGQEITRNIGKARTVVIDCLTLLVSNIFTEHEGADAPALEKAVVDEINGLTECIEQSDARFFIVTNEVGLGIVPADRTSRLYRDFLGRANQMLAARAEEVLFMVSGMPLTLKKP